RVKTLAFWLDHMWVDETSYDLDSAPCAQVIEQESLCYREGLTAVYPFYCQQLGVHAEHYIGLPLKTAAGQTVGHITLLDDRPISLPAAEWMIWSAILARAGIELERMQSGQLQKLTLRDAQQRAEQLAILYEMALDLTPTTDWLKLMKVVVERVSHLLGYPPKTVYAELYLYTEDDGLRRKRGFPARRKPVFLCERPTEQLRNYVLQTGEAHISSTLGENTFAYLLPSETRDAHIVRSSLMLPLLLGNQSVGLLYIGLNRSHLFVPDQVGGLLAFGDMLADLLQRMAHTHSLQTKLAQTEQALAETQARCEALGELRTKLIYDVAHELFMPASSIRLYLDLLAYCRLDDHARRYLLILQEKTEQLIKFSEDALHLSRLEEQPVEAPTILTHLQHDLTHLLALYRQVASRAGLCFTIDLDQKLPAVVAQPNQVRQAVAALLDNALAYTQTGSVVVKTAVNSTQTELALEISDSGIGIHPADVPYLFDRFYRGKQAPHHHPTGNGLGLAIAEEIMRQDNGWIQVESEPGQGATFRLWFPLLSL
ncbi:MAG: GAF domain-containing sensor histidine kinase, partial [Chloroflexota bacterium]